MFGALPVPVELRVSVVFGDLDYRPRRSGTGFLASFRRPFSDLFPSFSKVFLLFFIGSGGGRLTTSVVAYLGSLQAQSLCSALHY